MGFAIAFPTHQSCSFVVVFFLKAVFLLAIAPHNCSILFRISYNNLILETKGWDELREVKKAAAQRWCNAINADGKQGYWQYVMTGLIKVKEGIDQAWERVHT
ncbi:MAG: hypothetical protein ACKPEZ_16975 [Planktothrix sp.]